MKYILAFLAALVLLSGSSCYKIYCSRPPINLQFTGFDTSDLAIIAVNKYLKDGSFSNLSARQVYVQTSNIAFATPSNMILDADTVFFIGVMPGISIDADYDYTLFIPATGHTYEIKAISFGNESTQAGNSDGCTRSASWYLDGQLQKYGGYYYYDGEADIAIVK